MADEALARAGLYFDELNKVRLLKPEIAQNAGDMRDESKDFVAKVKSYQTTTDDLTNTIEKLAKLVEQEKLKAVGSRNALKTIMKQKENEKQQLQILIRERQIELERLRIEHEAAQRQELEQKDHLQQFLSPM